MFVWRNNNVIVTRKSLRRELSYYILRTNKTVPGKNAEELGISAGVLHNWKQLYRSEVEASSGHQSTPDRILQLELQLQAIELEKQQKERENADLQEEL